MSATPGEDIPGAFPADVSASTHDEHHRNKLHKRGDPRGWTDNESTPRTGTDSGLRSSHTRDASLSAQPTDYTYGSTIDKPSYNTEHEHSSRFDNQDRIHNQGQPTSTEEVGNPTQDSVTTIKRDESSKTAGMAAGQGTASALGSDNRTASGENQSSTGTGHNTVRGGLGNKSGIENSEPYWGDIPRGAGTYNTVVGHGSAEDSVEGHPKPHREFPLSTGTHGQGTHDHSAGTSTEHTAAKDSSLASGSPVAGQGTYNTVVGHGSQEDRTQHSGLPGSTSTSTDRENKDSLGKELAAGAGVAGLGGYAAQKYATKDDERTVDPSERRSHEEKHSKHGGIFSREHKDEPSKHEKERHEKEKHEKTTDAGDKKHFGIFSKSKKDSEEQGHSTAASTETRPIQDTTATNPTVAGQREQNDSHLGRDVGLAGAGLAGAGYAGHKYATRDEDKHHDEDKLRREESSKDKSSSGLHGLFHRKNKDKEIKESSSTRQDRSSTPPNAAEYYNDKQPIQVASALERKGKIEPGESTLYGETSTGHHDNLRSAGTAAAAAAAIPAATYASHKHDQSSTTNPSSAERSVQYDTLASGTPSGVTSGTHNTTQPSVGERGSQYDHLSSGTASGVSAGLVSSTTAHNQPATGARGGDPYDHLASGTPSGISIGLPTSTATHSRSAAEARGGDQYDHLASGTPSGVSTGLASSTTTRNQPAVGARGGDQYDHLASGTPSGVSSGIDNNNSHGRDNLAYAGAGAAGVGAAAYGAHKLHERRDNTTEPASTLNPASSAQRTSSTGDRHTSVASTGAPSLGAGAPHSVYGAPKDQEHRLHGLDKPSAGSRSTDLGSRSSQDSSKGGMYNVLSSGTPSGVNLDDRSSHSPSYSQPQTQPSYSQSQVQSQPQQALSMGQSDKIHDPLTSSSRGIDQNKMAIAGATAAFAGVGAAGYASTRDKDHLRDTMATSPTTAPTKTTSPTTATTTTTSGGKSYDDVIARAPERQVASETTNNDKHGTNLMSNKERHIDTSTDQNAGSAAYENKLNTSGGVFTGASISPDVARHMGNSPNTAGGGGSSSSGLSKPVMHACTECGKQNDISKYFSSEKDVARQ